jgi:predicted RNA-binding protein with PUA-like domain
MTYWLVKSEPFKYSWAQFAKDRRTGWDGVRNHQAANNLKAMKKGERVFFYHSNEGLEIVGIAEVAKTYYPDPSDATGRFGMVDLKPVGPLKIPVTLARIRDDPKLRHLPLVTQSRLSVMPIDGDSWRHICKLGGASAG